MKPNPLGVLPLPLFQVCTLVDPPYSKCQRYFWHTLIPYIHLRPLAPPTRFCGAPRHGHRKSRTSLKRLGKEKRERPSESDRAKWWSMQFRSRSSLVPLLGDYCSILPFLFVTAAAGTRWPGYSKRKQVTDGGIEYEPKPKCKRRFRRGRELLPYKVLIILEGFIYSSQVAVDWEESILCGHTLSTSPHFLSFTERVTIYGYYRY